MEKKCAYCKSFESVIPCEKNHLICILCLCKKTSHKMHELIIKIMKDEFKSDAQFCEAVTRFLLYEIDQLIRYGIVEGITVNGANDPLQLSYGMKSNCHISNGKCPMCLIEKTNQRLFNKKNVKKIISNKN